MDMTKLRISKDRLARIQKTMTNTQFKSLRNVAMRSGAAVHTFTAEISKRSLGDVKYFATSIDEASLFVRAKHAKRKGEAAELLKEHVMCVE